MAREEGPRALWKGLVPGLHRQVLLGGVRIASYDPIRDFYARALGEEGGKTSVATKIAAGITAGTLGVLVRGGSAGELRATAQAPALCAPTPLAAPAAAPCFPPQVGNPTDVLKVRMQAQGRLPPGAPPKYPSTLGAYRLIVRQEGLSALWTGTTPNIGARCKLWLSVAGQQHKLPSQTTETALLQPAALQPAARNAVVNAAELATYDQVRRLGMHAVQRATARSWWHGGRRQNAVAGAAALP